MSNKLSERDMARVNACAILFLASKRAPRIQQIADAKGISLGDAATMYTLGALKRAKRQGARTYGEALERLEAEQVGDRGNKITRTANAERLSRTVNRINRVNAGDKITIDGVQYVHDYDQIVTVDGVREAIPHFAIMDKVEGEPRTCKVMGTLYAQWEERKAKSDPAIQADTWINLELLQAERQGVDAINNVIDNNLRLYFADYAARLSRTAQRRLYELATSDTDPAYLMGKARDADNKAMRRAAWGAYTLYSGFPHRESISGVEFINLVRQHVQAPA